MNIGRIFNALSLLNPFTVKVAAFGDRAVAYRNLLGVKVLVTGKAETRALVDYVAKRSAKTDRVTKAIIGAPFAFVDAHQGQLLNVLLTPAKPEPSLKDLLPARMSPVDVGIAPLSAKAAGKRAVRFTTLPKAVAKPDGGPDVIIDGVFQNPPGLAKVLANKARGLPDGYTQAQKSWMTWNYPQLDMTVDVHEAHLYNAKWPLY